MLALLWGAGGLVGKMGSHPALGPLCADGAVGRVVQAGRR